MTNETDDVRELRLAWLNQVADLAISGRLSRTCVTVAVSISREFDWENRDASGAPLVGSHAEVSRITGTSKRSMGRSKVGLVEAGLITVDSRGKWFIPSRWYEGVALDD